MQSIASYGGLDRYGKQVAIRTGVPPPCTLVLKVFDSDTLGPDLRDGLSFQRYL